MDWKQELLKRLDAVAAGIGATGKYLWEVLIRQAIALGIRDLVFGVLFAVMFCKAVSMASRTWDKDLDNDGNMFQFIASVIVLSGSFLAALGFLSDATLELINPAYYALEKVLQTFGK